MGDPRSGKAWVRGPIKATSQLMYDVQALNADQRRRLLQRSGSGALPQQVGAQCSGAATRL